MKICFVDESGCTGRLPSATSNVQPSLTIGGMIIDYRQLARLTESFLQAKDKFFPGGGSGPTTYLGGILNEVKGSDLRKTASRGARNQRRHTFGFFDSLFKTCKEADARIIGRIWTKGIGEPFNGTSVYTSSIQAICANFQKYLVDTSDLGIVIADSRVKSLNSGVAHSIFTQKFKSSGDNFDRIIELPAFAHSDNHAGLQIVDMICSGIITPIVIDTFCKGHVQSVHTAHDYSEIKARYAQVIREMQYRWAEANGRFKGGLVVSDSIGKLSGSAMFTVRGLPANANLPAPSPLPSPQPPAPSPNKASSP